MEDEDFDGAYAKFIGQYGDNAEELFPGMNLRNYFTPKYRDQLIGNRLIDMTPKISQYVNATGGRVDDPAAFANYLVFQRDKSNHSLTLLPKNMIAKLQVGKSETTNALLGQLTTRLRQAAIQSLLSRDCFVARASVRTISTSRRQKQRQNASARLKRPNVNANAKNCSIIESRHGRFFAKTQRSKA